MKVPNWAIVLSLLIMGYFLYTGGHLEGIDLNPKPVVPLDVNIPDKIIPIKSVGDQGDFIVYVLDVGQGDATLLKYPNGEWVLIDTGPKSSQARTLNFLKDYNALQLDYLVLTHHDADHIGAVEYLIDNNLQFINLLESIDECETRTCNDTKIALTKVEHNKVFFDWQQDLGLSLPTKILNPMPLEPFEGRNNNSIVLFVMYNELGLLLTGDCESKCEQQIVRNFEFETEILKAGHHGSRTSSNDYFLELVQPETVLISSGQGNRYGHPHLESLERFQDYNAEVYRTDELGNYAIIIRSGSYEFEDI